MLDVVFVTNVPAPYKFSRFEALAAMDNINLTVYYANDETGRHRYSSRDSDQYTTHHKHSWKIAGSGVELLVDTWSLREFLTISADIFVIGGWNYTAAWSAIVAGRLRNVPTAIVSANVSTGNGPTRWLIRQGIRCADAYFALSSTAADDLAALGADNADIFILPNSTEISSFRSNLSAATQAEILSKYHIDSRFLVLYVGNLEQEKGISDLIAATESLEDTCLMIVGDGPERAALQSESGGRVGDSVVFTGWIDNSDLANYYAAADVFCLPTYGDTWGLVLNEALSCGTPVITTSAAGAVGDLVKHEENGLVVSPGNVTSLRRALNRLRKDETLREAFANQGDKDIEQYTPQKYAEKLKSSLEHLL